METYQNVSYHHHHHQQQQQQQESSQFLCDQQTMSTSCSSSSSLDEKSLISASSTTSFVPIATQQPEDPEQVAPSGRQGRRESSLMCENLEQPETSFELGSPTTITTTSGTDAKPTEQTPASQPDGKDQPGEAVSKQTDTNNNTSDYPDQHYGYQNEQYSGQWTASDQYGQQVSGANNQYFNANSPLRESTNTRQDCHDKPASEPQQQMVDANNNHQYNSYCYQPEAARYQSYQHYDQGQQHQPQQHHQQQQHQHQPTQNVALYDVGGHVIEYRPVAEQAELSQQPAQLDYYDNQAAYPCYSGLEPPSSFYSDVVVDPNNNHHHHHHQQQQHYHQQHDYYQHQDTSHMLHPLEQENDSCKTYTSLERSSRTRDLLADPYNLGSGSSSAPAHVVHHIPAAVDGNEAMEVGDWAEWLPSGEPYQPSSSSSSSAYHNQQVPVVSQSYDPSAELNWNLDANLAQEDSNANEFAGWSGDSNRDEEEEEEEADEDEEAEEEEYEEEEEEEDDDDDDESMVSSCPGERAKRRARKRAASVVKNSHRPNQTALTNPLGRPRGCSRSTLQKLRTFLLTRMPKRPTSSHPGGTSMLLCKKSPAAAAEVKAAQTIHQTDNSRSKPAELKMAASLQGSPVIVRGPNSSNEPTGASRKRPAEETTDSEEAGVIADNRQLRNRTIIISSRGSSQGGSHRSPSLSATSTPHNEEEPLEEQDDNDHEDEPGQATCSGVQTRARKRQRQIERETRQTRLSCSSLSSTPPWSSSLCSTSSSRCRRGRSSSSTSSSFLPAVEISMDCN